jgi:hypothetical protein
MDLFHLINFSEGLGSEDVDLDVPDGFRAFKVVSVPKKYGCFS